MREHYDYLELVGKKFGDLEVVGMGEPYVNPKTGEKQKRLLVRCVCGKEFSVHPTSLIKRGYSSCKSCSISKLNKIYKRKHGLREHPLYHVWFIMKQRCSDNSVKDYPNYGGRGIYVCHEWENDFQSFYDWSISHGYETGLQIDRIDNDGPYSPDNCRFVTLKENCNNRRNTHYINGIPATTYFAESKKDQSVSYLVFWNRYFRRHWDLEKALMTPKKEQ